jgi:hypothetical protein
MTSSPVVRRRAITPYRIARTADHPHSVRKQKAPGVSWRFEQRLRPGAEPLNALDPGTSRQNAPTPA